MEGFWQSNAFEVGQGAGRQGVLEKYGIHHPRTDSTAGYQRETRDHERQRHNIEFRYEHWVKEVWLPALKEGMGPENYQAAHLDLALPPIDFSSLEVTIMRLKHYLEFRIAIRPLGAKVARSTLVAEKRGLVNLIIHQLFVERALPVEEACAVVDGVRGGTKWLFEQLDDAVAAFIELYQLPASVVPRQAWGRRELEVLQRDIIASLSALGPQRGPDSFDALMGQLCCTTILFYTLLCYSSVLSGPHSQGQASKDEDVRFRRELGRHHESLRPRP